MSTSGATFPRTLPSGIIRRLRVQLRERILILSLFGAVLMSAPVLQSYYPIKDAKQDMVRRVKRAGRRTARKIESLTK